MLVKILIALAGLLLLFVAVAATRPSAYRVERKIAVEAPPDRVFGILNDLHQFAGVLVLFGSPWETLDPDMQKTFGGPSSGVGQSYAWNSKKEVGQGTMTIEESVPGKKVGVKLEFVKPMKSTATCALTLDETPTGSIVTWSMAGNHNLVGKAMGLFLNMDKMLGSDIEKGLARVKAAAEGPTAAPTAATADPANAGAITARS